MKLDNIHNVYFLGIGGIGMSALARYFNAAGKNVAGYDKTPTVLTTELISEGISIHFEDNVSLIPENFKSEIPNQKSEILVVYTPAVPKDHSEYVFFSLKGFNIKKRAEVLGIIAEHMHTIAVAGTHGKTTTSSMVAHILRSSGNDCSAFLGGITQNYGTNLLLGSNLKGKNADAGKGLLVVEADEYDRSFLTLHPDVAIITSLDADHLDIYGDKNEMEKTYSQFASQVKRCLIVKNNYADKLKFSAKTYTYSYHTKADYYAQNIRIENEFYVYDIISPVETIKDAKLGIPGLHNIENSVAAAAAAQQVGISNEEIKKALFSFRGVKRRFDYQVKTKELVFIDDYAHHPEELRACITSVKDFYPGRKVTGVFQPHLYTRTRDFADGFAQSLDLLDETILLDIYPARELPIEGVTSKMLLEKMKSKNKMVCSKSELVSEVIKRKLEVLLTLGAGDIDTLVEPLRKKLTNEKV